MKFHLDGPNASRDVTELSPEAPPYQHAQALRRAQSQRERQYDRNHFQNPGSLRAPIEVDELDCGVAERHSFQGQSRPQGSDRRSEEARRQSTGNVLGGALSRLLDVSPPAAADSTSSPDRQDSWNNDYELAAFADEHRVDWTQSDEIVPRSNERHASLGKHESRWNLRARMKLSKGDSNDGASREVEKQKSGFFARFKH
jgi:hypothetical protein